METNYAKLLLAAKIREEVLKEMGIQSMDQNPKIKQMAPSSDYEGAVYAVLDEIRRTAQLLDNN